MYCGERRCRLAPGDDNRALGSPRPEWESSPEYCSKKTILQQILVRCRLSPAEWAFLHRRRLDRRSKVRVGPLGGLQRSRVTREREALLHHFEEVRLQTS